VIALDRVVSTDGHGLDGLALSGQAPRSHPQRSRRLPRPRLACSRHSRRTSASPSLTPTWSAVTPTRSPPITPTRWCITVSSRPARGRRPLPPSTG
jgi:hypothetical protein